MKIRMLVLLLCLAAGANVPCQAGSQVRLAEDGKALLPIVVSPAASDEVKAYAAELADYLQRISGAPFEVKSGDGQTGLAIGRASDFPLLKPDVDLSGKLAERREDYQLRSHVQGVWLLGATDQAVRHAVWDFLYRLGHRQFFPGEHWEVIPSQPQLTVEVDAFEHPSYASRRIWYGYGAWDYAKEPYRQWCERNRCVQGIVLNTGHAYDGILARNKAQFAEHPEYLGLIDGERKSTKFCISNPGLRRLVADDALAQLAADPNKQSISVDPSDGGNWCECENCKQLGSITDRAVTLANTVATAVAEQHPDVYVGMYAYSYHSPPPSIPAHPRVVVSVATAFINGGYTVDQLLAGWSAKASTLGIREYYSVNTWDRDLPGAARGGRLDYLQQTIPHFHSQSVRFLSAESSDNWGPNGLGYYLASRFMWDVTEADQRDQLQDDFLQKCFGDAQEPMKRFYTLLDGGHRQPLCDDLVGRMYRLLDEAHQATDDEAIQARLADLTLYTRYVELWLDYSIAKEAARQTAFEAMLRHVWRMRETMMVHSLALYRDVVNRDKSVSLPENARWNAPAEGNPLKSSEPFLADELARIRREGIANRPLLEFTPTAYSDDLVPAMPLSLESGKPGSMGIYSRSPRNYYTWIENSPATLSLSITGGVIYQNRGLTRIALYPTAETEGKAVAQAEVPPTRTPETVDLATTFTGLHRLEILAGGGARSEWLSEAPFTVESSFERPGALHGRWSLYFYVPRGTTTVGGFGQGVGRMLNGSGELVHTFSGKPGYFSVPVPPGEDGRLWKFDHCASDKLLMTVPPYLAPSAAQLLLPREVVQRDQQK
ncbi:DUF4838 domain-containing protein [Lignipirellula cremea]|uniref:Alpha glucuronidase N-terminal domain-containing protein n=1 Tax=Lignipirellula cremea TaxID=2528010 RepID=A0A518DSH6_9BACT|nr:DUF4838 domain-containing protein [Lignipirellula cremea]QDU94738.1 hypothetical protein Pla8534_25440 [Lignipirellula cremea]